MLMRVVTGIGRSIIIIDYIFPGKFLFGEKLELKGFWFINAVLHFSILPRKMISGNAGPVR